MTPETFTIMSDEAILALRAAMVKSRLFTTASLQDAVEAIQEIQRLHSQGEHLWAEAVQREARNAAEAIRDAAALGVSLCELRDATVFANFIFLVFDAEQAARCA